MIITWLKIKKKKKKKKKRNFNNLAFRKPSRLAVPFHFHNHSFSPHFHSFIIHATMTVEVQLSKSKSSSTTQPSKTALSDRPQRLFPSFPPISTAVDSVLNPVKLGNRPTVQARPMIPSDLHLSGSNRPRLQAQSNWGSTVLGWPFGRWACRLCCLVL
jgi:hypothetical protein